MDTTQEFILGLIKQNAVDVIWIIILFFFGKIILRIIVKQLAKIVDDGDDEHVSQKEKRAETLGQIMITTGNIVIYAVILLMVLNIFGVDIRPILAGAGIIGLAIGFGAQSLVKDFVSGLFILVEDQYGIGDKVKIGSSEGRVIRITMRSTVLKDEEGKLYYVSNGSINNVINLSQQKKSS
ncbi:mechanosensitive ion channel family protein [Patescibacteria group bacterium]|nr:mechanosensitive ion channel family protein [Patescibacteria group bacterium]MBU1895553.1 mechanosensitive ion channel family protein [Patescibacteria group bacterium]